MIVVVLALVALATFLLGRFIERSMTEMLVEARARQTEQLRAEAHSALEAALAVLADYQVLDHGLRSPAQGWGDPLVGVDLPVSPGTTVEVQVEDESSRPSLPHLDSPALVALGRELGLIADESTALAEALLAWTRPDSASVRAETDPRHYEYEALPHRAPGRPLESWGELAAIAVARRIFYTPDGQPTELQARWQRRVSLYDFPAINLNTAGTDTLAQAGFDDSQIAALRDFRAGRGRRGSGVPPYFRSLAEAQAVLGPAPLEGFATEARVLRVRVTVHTGGASFLLAAVVRPAGDGAAPAASAATPTPSASLIASATPAPEKDLRYPFTLLALEENLELSPPPS